MNTGSKAPMWFLVVSALALAWNLLGVMAFAGQALAGPEAYAELPENERLLMEAQPSWVLIAMGLATVGGALGALLLLMRRRAAGGLLRLSLLGIAAQMGYVALVSKAFEVYGPGGLVMPVMVLVVGVLLVWLAQYAGTRGWLR